MTANDIINIIESVAPLGQQAGWDNSGLQVGNRGTEVARVLLCTDITDLIIEEAIEKNCKMIISHHPLLFRGIKRIEGNTRSERCVINAIRHNIVLYSSHTSMDNYLHGVSGKMADKLGIKNYQILSPLGTETGLGVIGQLDQPLNLIEFLRLLKTTFVTQSIKYVERLTDTNFISTVAICGGAGSEFMETAISLQADAYVSADFKYHDLQTADGRLNVFDIGHFESEQFTKEIFYELLTNTLVECIIAENDISPVKTYVG